MKRERYEAAVNWFTQNRIRYLLLKICYHWFPYGIVLLYVGLIAYFSVTLQFDRLLRSLLGPSLVFGSVTVFRKVINRKRPYEQWPEFSPAFSRKKSGESFPSRHAASASIIALTTLAWNLPLGIAACIVSALIAASRALAGVHFWSDIIVAVLWSSLIGVPVLFWMPVLF